MFKKIALPAEICDRHVQLRVEESDCLRLKEHVLTLSWFILVNLLCFLSSSIPLFMVIT